MSNKEMAEMFKKYLDGEGFAAKIDSDGDIAFKYEGGTYLILISEDDDIFFRLVYPNFWEIESEEERMKAYIAASTATANVKVAKVHPQKDNVWASIEMFISPMENFQTVFMRSISALQSGIKRFRDEMNKS